MKSTTRTVASGMLVLSLMHTSLASVPMNGTGRIDAVSDEMAQALEIGGVANSQVGQIVANVNDVVGGQSELDSGCWTCFAVSFVLLTLLPPAGLAAGIGCTVACFDVF